MARHRRTSWECNHHDSIYTHYMSILLDYNYYHYHTLNCGVGLVSLDEKTLSIVSFVSSAIMERSLPEEKGLFIGSSVSGVNRSIRSSKYLQWICAHLLLIFM